MNSAAESVPGLVIVFAVVVIGVFWIFFPMLVVSKLGQLVKESKRQTEVLEDIARNTRQTGKGAPQESSVRY